MTFNIHHGKGNDKQINLDRIANVIKNGRADIVALNEVDKRYGKRSHFEDQAGMLAEKLNMYHAFSPSIRLKSANAEERQYGNGLLSRFPIVNKKLHAFDFVRGLVEGRSMLETTIKTNEKHIQVFVTHLSLNPFLHRKQTESIMKTLSNSEHSSLLMGDWNMRPGSRGWRRVTEELQDTWYVAGKGSGHTYSANRPRMRLDYIFASSAFRVLETKVVSTDPSASDHLPVIATLELD